MSNLDSTRISEIVDSLERVFDEDDSGYVGMLLIYVDFFCF